MQSKVEYLVAETYYFNCKIWFGLGVFDKRTNYGTDHPQVHTSFVDDLLFYDTVQYDHCIVITI